MVTRGGNGRIHNGHVVNGAIHNEASGGTQGCFLLGMSAFFTFVGGVLCIVGPCLEQRSNTSYSNSTRVEYDLFFYQEKISIRNGASVTSPVSDCIQAPYSAAMAMAIIGAAITLLIALPLTYCAIKFKASSLRFIRPMVLFLGGIIAMIGVVLTVTTTSCNGNDFGDDYKLTIGFFILVGGASVILLAAFLNLLQAAICPEANPPSTEQVVIVHHQTATSGNGDQSMLFVPTNNGAQQQQQHYQQQAGGAPAFNFASQHQQQHQQHTGQPQGYGGGNVVVANAGLYGGGMMTSANNGPVLVANNEANGGGPQVKGGGCYPLGLSAFFTFVGGVLTIVGSCLQQRRYSYISSSSNWPINYDLFFYQEKISVRFGASATSPVSDCIKAPYAAAMAMSIIGAAIALLGALPLTYCAIKFKASPLRFIRPMALLAGVVFVMIGVILSATTTTCEGNDFSDVYKLSTGFFILIAGMAVMLLAAFINLLQAVSCPDATATPNQHAIAQQQAIAGGGQSPQMAFASSNAAPQQQQQHQQAGGAPVYNFASQQQQQPQYQQQQQQAYGGGGGVDAGLYGGGGGGGAPNNAGVYGSIY